MACVIGVLAGSAIVSAADLRDRDLELQIKAGFLYTFVKYVDWPEDAFKASSNTVVIGVLGKDPFGTVLDTTVAGKKINGRAVHIKRFQRVEEIGACHVLFVSESEKERLGDVLASLRGRKTLTVSEAEGFLQQGGQIQLVMESDRVRFDINMEAARQAGLKLSSHLLRVARYLINRPKPGEDGMR
jgi:hypothetical protein